MKRKHIINTLLIIILILFFASVILIRPVKSLDELWNYSFAKNIANGLVPYKDFNMVQTPLFAFICGVFLKITNELITMRILAIILNTGIIILMYKILKTLKVNSYIAYICLAGIIWLMKDYVTIDYNFFVVLFALIIVLLELKKDSCRPPLHGEMQRLLNLNFRVDLFIGILAGLAIITKQTTGLAIAFVAVGYKVLTIRNLEQFKTFLKIFAIRMLGVIIPILILLIYLVLNNAMADFVDYTISGISTFTNKISYTNLFVDGNILYKTLSVGVPIVMIALFLKGLITKDNNSLLLALYGAAGFIVVFPIADDQHFLVSILITLLGFIYLIKCLLEYVRFIKIKQYTVEAVTYISIIIAIFVGAMSVYNLSKYVGQIKNEGNQTINHYKYVPISEGLSKDVINIINYIKNQEQEVYIIDSQAIIYRIPMDTYYKNYDMLLNGNLGSGGAEKQIADLKNKENILVLIKPNGYNWQLPMEIINYVKTNMNKIGTIDLFDIYSK
ncbi:MAG: hypothetical protein FWF46_06665 [Oscillospiraceae bacterium]|nr:hypothetical protein [Oscillospiraceae bacterium]